MSFGKLTGKTVSFIMKWNNIIGWVSVILTLFLHRMCAPIHFPEVASFKVLIITCN